MKNLNTYYKYKINMILMGFIIFGALNYGLTVFGFNIIDIVSNQINNLINKQIYLDKIIMSNKILSDRGGQRKLDNLIKIESGIDFEKPLNENKKEKIL